MAEAVILDRGYRHYQGARLGRSGAMRAVVREGIRRILGLRRKARRKIIPWTLITIVLIQVAIFLGIHYAASVALGGAIDVSLPRNGEFFDFTSVVALLFVTMAAPELLIPDRTQGVLSVYFSRPLGVSDYLFAKAGALAAVVLGIYLIPQIVLHIGLATLSADGFLAYLRDNLDVLWKIGVVSLVFLAVHASLAMALAALIPRRGFAAASFLGGVLILNIVTGIVAITELPGARYFALLGFERHPRIVRDWIFDIETVDYTSLVVGFEPWHSLLAAAGVVVISVLIIWDRYRRLA